ncbi:membrane-spanning 4-domains subfamily A member 4A-like [Rana temporaria]|uniref:membrane-spanning 4-domains subfamily A member 4A-like n=1 Tax=Rana temporaria TaxID=8407 RepID=UPI001AACB116|nr:membrane-spanning 4-domains subfamily A member 4A-like [Rana temporaria]
MSSSQFSDKPQNINSAQLNPAAPPPAQLNVPGYNLSPNPQMWNAPTAQQWNPQAPQQWNNPIITVTPQMTQSTMFHQEFLKGKPKALGITLIIVGIIHFGMGFGQIFTSSLIAIYSGIPFWGAIFNIIAGSLSVAAVSKPSICLINGSLGLSIMISIFSVVGLILNIVDFFVNYYCYDYNYEYYYGYECNGSIVGGHVLRGFFILTYLLQFSVSVSLSVFACRAQAHSNSTQPAQVFVIQNSAPVFQPSAVPGSYPTYPPQQPPPYMTQSGMGGGPTVYQNPSS